MAIPSFFKQNKPRGFNYVPRYYDPAKEEREQRLREWKNEHARIRQLAEMMSRRAGEQGAGDEEQGEENSQKSSRKAGEDSQNQPYRSKIMRGDMKNYFHRRKERVERHTTIRLIVIILIIVLVVYLYLHF
jgi:hypothetical protein